MSDSDDNLALAQVARSKKRRKVESSDSESSDDEDNTPLNQLVSVKKKKSGASSADKALARKVHSEFNSRPSRAAKPQSFTEAKSDSEDFENPEDNEPLSQLVEKRKLSKKAASATKKAKAKKPTKSSKSPAKKTSSGKGVVHDPKSPAVVNLTGKHELAHAILQRWSYCLSPSSTSSNFDEPGFIECGFKGVFVGVQGDSYGIIKDTRVKGKMSPALNSLLEAPAEKLKELLLAGVKKQVEDLEKHESGRVLEKQKSNIASQRKKFEKIDPKKAEREYLSWEKKQAKKKKVIRK